MSPTIQHDDAVRLLRMLDDGDDPLGIAEHVVRREDDDPAEEVRHAASLLLSGKLPVPDDAPVQLQDPITAHLLAHHGADPLAAAAICHAARGVGIVDGADDKIASLMAKVPYSLVHADPLRWESIPGHLRAPALPDTVVSAMAGRLLSEVLSHPALDLLPVTVNSAVLDEDAGWMTLHLHPRDPTVLLGRERLAAVARLHRGA